MEMDSRSGEVCVSDGAIDDMAHAAEQTFAIHVPVIQLYITASTPNVLLNCS